MARPLPVFLLGTLGIAFAAIFVRLALPAPPVVTAFYRVAIAMALLWTWLLASGQWHRPTNALVGRSLLAGLFFGLDMALWNTAVVETSVANATLLVNTTPILVGAWAFLRGEPPDRFVVGGGLLAALGAAWLVGADLGDGALRGDLLALGAAFFYAGYLVVMKELRGALDAVRAVAIAGVAAALVLGATAFAQGDPFAGFPARSWLVFVACAVVSHLGGVLGIVWALRGLRATFAAVALLAQPVGTALLGWWILGEGLGLAQWWGGGLVVAGILLAAQGRTDDDGAG